jgi:hypothetical protein
MNMPPAANSFIEPRLIGLLPFVLDELRRLWRRHAIDR